MKSEALRRGKAGGGRIFKKRKSTSKKDIVSNKNAKNTDIIDNSVSSSAKKLRKSQEYFSNSAAVQPTMSSISYDKNTASVNIDTHQTDTGMCPRTSESWCKYQADRINNTNTYKHKPGLPIIVKDATKSIFMDLYDIDLLKKCLHGETQNNNEGFKCHYMEKLPERCLCRLDST